MECCICWVSHPAKMVWRTRLGPLEVNVRNSIKGAWKPSATPTLVILLGVLPGFK